MEQSACKNASFALVVHDLEGAMGLGVTHLVANIPPSAPVLPKMICVTAKAIPAVKPPAPCSGMVLALHRVAAHTYYTFTDCHQHRPGSPKGLTRDELFAKLKATPWVRQV
jgi:hypothetical protein